MAQATHFRHPMEYTGKPGESWAGYVFKEELGYTTGRHTGVDYNYDKAGRDGNGDKGMPLYAIANARVAYTGDLTWKGFGKTLILEITLSQHLKNKLGTSKLYARYMHCDRIHVRGGQEVSIGTHIADVGNTGTTWAHLHLDLWKENLGIHHEYHKDSQLASYLDPYWTIENNKTPQEEKEEDMLTPLSINIVFRLRLHRDCDPQQARDLIRDYKNVDELDDWVRKLPEYKRKVKTAAETQSVPVGALGSDYRDAIKAPRLVANPSVDARKLNEGMKLLKEAVGA